MRLHYIYLFSYVVEKDIRGTRPGIVWFGSLRETAEERKGDGIPKGWEPREIGNKFLIGAHLFVNGKTHRQRKEAGTGIIRCGKRGIQILVQPRTLNRRLFNCFFFFYCD